MSLAAEFKADLIAVQAVFSHFLSSARTEISALFHETANVVAAAIKQEAPQIEGDIVAFLKTSALAAVAAASATPGTGQAKMAAALAALTAAFAEKALPLLENEARVLLETALLVFKSELAPK